MTAEVIELRWIAPPGSDVHPRLALVRHDGRLFSYCELLTHLPRDTLVTTLEGNACTPQELWDDVTARSPEVAHRVAERCQPLDNDILDLYAVRARGSA